MEMEYSRRTAEVELLLSQSPGKTPILISSSLDEPLPELKVLET
jgi:hypothetical protein